MDLQPYLPPKSTKKAYTLVLDLDETLMHYSEDQEDEEPLYFIRPGLHSFLETLSAFYEIVVFTAAQSDYADFFVA